MFTKYSRLKGFDSFLIDKLSAIPLAKAMNLHAPIGAGSVNSQFGTHIKKTSDSNNSSTNV